MHSLLTEQGCVCAELSMADKPACLAVAGVAARLFLSNKLLQQTNVQHIVSWTVVMSQVRRTVGGGPARPPQLQQFSDDLWPLRSQQEAEVAGRDCRDFVLALQERLLPRVGELSPEQVATVLWALAAGGLVKCKLARRLVDRAASLRLSDMSPSFVVHLLWAVCALQGPHLRKVVYPCVEVINECPPSAISLIARRLLDHVALYLRVAGPLHLRPPPTIKPELLGYDPRVEGRSDHSPGWSHPMWSLPATANEGSSSHLHKAVSTLLHKLGIPHTNEQHIGALHCTVDIHITHSPILIEIYGPLHFAFGGSELRGGTQMKERLLRLEGWMVVPIPYFEWHAVEDSPRARSEYLLGKIGGYVPAWDTLAAVDGGAR